MAPVNQAVPSFSDVTLARVPGRALTLLAYLGRTRSVYAAMKLRGFKLSDLHEGWALLKATGGFVAEEAEPDRDPVAAESLAFLDAWDEPNFRRLIAAVRRMHPEAVEALFGGISPGTGSEAILSVSMLLDRVEKLPSGPHPEVLETLEGRGLTPDVRADLREHIRIAKGFNPSEHDPADAQAIADCHREKLMALKLWFDDWAETARTAGLSRYHLINLGLAKRKKAAAPAPVEELDDELDDELDETG